MHCLRLTAGFRARAATIFTLMATLALAPASAGTPTGPVSSVGQSTITVLDRTEKDGRVFEQELRGDECRFVVDGV